MKGNRGGHAHVDTDQVVVAVSGKLQFNLLTKEGARYAFLLDDPCTGLYIPRMTFLDIIDISPDAVCVVLANTHYDASQTIRRLEDFINITASGDKAVK